MDEAFVLDGETNYTYPQLLDLIEQHGSVILSIQYIAIEPLKSALAVRKSRRLRALKEQEIPTEDQKLTYTQLTEADKDGWVSLRIDLKSTQGIRVKSITIPGEF